MKMRSISSLAWHSVASILLICLMFLVSPSMEPARASGQWYVAPGGNDSNDCLGPTTPCSTINGAIEKASSGDTIYVAVGTYTNSSDPEVVLIDESVTLSGGWNINFTAQDGYSTINGQGTRRGITVGNSIPSITLERFTIQNGIDQVMGGGGILINNSSNVIVVNSNIINNTASPAFFGGGGILNWGGTLNLIDSIVSGNHGGYSGGGIANTGTMTITNSTINGNSAGDSRTSRTGSGGGGIYNQGTLLLTNSNVSANTILGSILGSGIHNRGSWLSAGITVNNSTISGNSNGDGLYTSHYPVHINNSTIYNNQRLGLLIDDGSVVTLQNTIIANNGYDCYNYPGHLGVINSLGYNLIQYNSNCTLANSDLVGVDPRLFALQGSPGYHPLLPDSPAINAGNPSGCSDHLGNPLNSDQRGASRVGPCDIGAYEYDPANDPLRYVSLPFVTNNLP